MSGCACAHCGSVVTFSVGENGIAFVLCDLPGCGAVTSFRARSTPEETVELYRARNDPSIRAGYAEALLKASN